MAEWRTRGYVADSDDEDETQNSLQPSVDLAEAPSVSDNETPGATTFGGGSSLGHSGQGNIVIGEREKGSGGGNTSSESAILATLEPSEHKDDHGRGLKFNKDGRHGRNALQPQDGGDIDELQEDNYQGTPAAQLEAELLLGARELASSTLSSHSSLNQRPPTRLRTSSPSSESSGGPRDSSPLKDKIQSSLGAHRVDKGSERWTTSSTSDPEQSIQINREAETTKVTRSLRQRNPIQLHPYAIESEKYRQILKARGVKPLRIAQMEAEAASAREEESQNIEYVEEESQDPGKSIGSNNLGSSSPLDIEDLHIEPDEVQEGTLSVGDDELPEVDALFSHPSRIYIGNGYKRRRIASSSFRMPSGMSSEGHKSPPSWSSRDACEHAHRVQDVPPSPPRSRSQTPVRTFPTTLPRFQPPSKPSKDAIPTPMTSSEPRRPQVLEILVDDQPESPSHVRAGMEGPSDESESDRASSSSKASSQLQRVQRKIRGVLPASWLKIDLKAQKKLTRDVERSGYSSSPEKHHMHRGVARPVSGRSKKNLDSSIFYDAAFPVSDSEDSLRDSRPLPKRLTRPDISLENHDGGDLRERWGEAAENDHIDAMLPSATRQRHPTRKKHKRQTKLPDVELDSRPITRHRQDSSHSHRLDHGRNVDEFNKGHRRKPKFRPPELSILDTSLNSSIQGAVPAFLKVASRAVRSRKDQGRHSPSQKYLRLATQADDEDVSETLRNWREGTIIPAANSRANCRPVRQPLLPRSANNVEPPRSPNGRNLSEPKNPLHSPPAMHLIPLPKRRKLQSSLDRLVHRQSKKPVEPRATPSHQNRMEQLKKKGQVFSSIRGNDDSRPAMLETLGDGADEPFAKANFQRDLTRINRLGDESGIPNVLRLFDENGVHLPDDDFPRRHSQNLASRPNKSNITTKKPKVQRRKERQPQHVDVSTSWSRRSSTHTIIDDIPDITPSLDVAHLQNGSAVAGLEPFGTHYSDDFGTTPLPTGTCFHESTYIGSGAFARTLELHSRLNLDSSRGYTLFRFDGQLHRWGPWNDIVSSELGEVVTWISQFHQIQPTESQRGHSRSPCDDRVSALKAIVTYFSDHLSFLDPVDRLSCVQRCKALTAMLLLELDSETGSSRIAESERQETPRLALLQLRTIVLVFANQLCQISQHELVHSRLRDEVRSMVQRNTQIILGIVTNGIGEFENCILHCKRSDAARYMLRGEQVSVEAFVVAQQIIVQEPNHADELWRSVLTGSLATIPNDSFDCRLHEKSWKRLFTFLPFLEFNSRGVVETGRRFNVPFDNWLSVKQLIHPVLEASLTNPRGQMPNFNVYCRALFRRCLHLINGWGWRRCESIIGTLFDFFTRNHLAHLRNEESHGSPLFLEHLARKPSLAAEPEDRCFHILLKIIGSGIRHMRQIYSEKKIRDIIWRLMPNHGRSHPKEEAIHQSDLDALRNHHDLLCTLYWASPPSCRPRLIVIRNLAHLESSHREACHINIRAWFNLVKFQLSTDEPISCLDAFVMWHDDLLRQILHQHSLARTEAEDQVRSIQHAGGLTVSNELLESTIATNQRQVEAILNDVLISLKLAVEAAQSEQAAAALVTTTLTKAFDLFDAGQPRSTKPVIQALDVLSALASKGTDNQQRRLYDANDDSQDYGDWPNFEEDNDALAATEASAIELPLQKFQEPLKHLLSNAFGSDIVPDDVLLLKIVNVWVAIAQVLVRRGMRSWNDYVDPFGSDSWSLLRDTEQTRKYTVLYLATLIEMDRAILADHANFLVKSWIGSLVERESLLKFQHRLTEALLNAECDDPILHNLPFWTNSDIARFEVSAGDFSERRISLISSVLSNMRMSLEEAVFSPSKNATQLRQEYKDMLRHLMGTMKHNYQALGHGSSVRGAYVTFVHKVVELLQQHTSSICPVDRFFTDNEAFPLPATDPTYVVGQLKHYALRLQDSRAPKQLAVFLQSVSERAAVDGQQPYLVTQLHAAMSNAFEDGVSARPTFRFFLVKAIVPAYVEMACTTFGPSCGWILALPYLQALQDAFKDFLLVMNGADPHSVRAVASTITAFSASVRQSFGHFLSPSNQLGEAGILKLMSACYSVITRLLPLLDYVARLSGPVERAINDIWFLGGFASWISARLQKGDGDHDLERKDVGDLEYSDIRHFAMQELKGSLVKNWSYVDSEQQYYFTRGASRREVVVDIGLYEEEKVNLLNVLAEFFTSLEVMPSVCDDDDDLLASRRKRVSGFDQLIF